MFFINIVTCDLLAALSHVTKTLFHENRNSLKQVIHQNVSSFLGYLYSNVHIVIFLLLVTHIIHIIHTLLVIIKF